MLSLSLTVFAWNILQDLLTRHNLKFLPVGRYKYIIGISLSLIICIFWTDILSSACDTTNNTKLWKLRVDTSGLEITNATARLPQ